MRLKSWESKQASARLRQLKKRNQQLRKRLKANGSSDCDKPKAPGTYPGAFLWPLPQIIGELRLPVFNSQVCYSSSQHELLRFASLSR
jgi:hypothetical protein